MQQVAIKALAEKVLQRDKRTQRPSDTGDKDVLHGVATDATPCDSSTVELASCDCHHLPDGKPARRPDCPIVAALRSKPGLQFWFERHEPDPAGDAVNRLLKSGEYLDERGVIRRVQ